MPKQNFRHSHCYLSDHAYFSNTDILSPPLGSSAAALTWVYVPAVVQTASEAAPDTWLEHKYYKLWMAWLASMLFLRRCSSKLHSDSSKSAHMLWPLCHCCWHLKLWLSLAMCQSCQSCSADKVQTPGTAGASLCQSPSCHSTWRTTAMLWLLLDCCSLQQQPAWQWKLQHSLHPRINAKCSLLLHTTEACAFKALQQERYNQVTQNKHHFDSLTLVINLDKLVHESQYLMLLMPCWISGRGFSPSTFPVGI